MKEIPLTQGKVAVVDDEDLALVARFKWHAVFDKGNWCAVAYSGRLGTVRMHRLILGLKLGDGQHGDHEDGNGLNNTRANLRVATRRENALNSWRRREGHTSSPFPGVHFEAGKRRWRASLKWRGQSVHLGTFRSEEEAAVAYHVGSMVTSRLRTVAEHRSVTAPALRAEWLQPLISRALAVYRRTANEDEPDDAPLAGAALPG